MAKSRVTHGSIEKANGTNGGNRIPSKGISYASALTGIATDEAMVNAIDEIYKVNMSGKLTMSPERQLSLALNAIGKMQALQNLRARAGAKRNTKQAFFLNS